VAAATVVAAAVGAIWVAMGADVATEVLAIFFDGLTGVNNAQARFKGTFHLGYGGHDQLPFYSGD